MDPLARKKIALQNKIDVSIKETEMFEDDIQEIEEQLQQEQDNTISELDEKLELMIEMLKNRKECLAKAVVQHYKKQEIFLMEGKKNVERRKANLGKLKTKISNLKETQY